MNGNWDISKLIRNNSTSSRLSSATRICAALLLVYLVFICQALSKRNGEAKCTALSGRRLHPNLAAETVYDTTTDRQSDARAGIVLLIVQPLEDFKDTVVMLWGDANPVVAYRKCPIVPG